MFIKKAFTLAEVLITLGILGIVASITIPTIMQNANGTKYRVAFKNGLATLNHAVALSSTKYNLDFANAKQSCNLQYVEGDVKVDETRSFCGIFSRTLASASYSEAYLDSSSEEFDYGLNSSVTLSSTEDYSVYTLANGMFLAFSRRDKNNSPCKLSGDRTLTSAWIKSHPQCLGFIDVNGVDLPNREVACTNGVTTDSNFDIPCTVDKKSITDIFPIVFYNSTVEPASNAAVYVLNSTK